MDKAVQLAQQVQALAQLRGQLRGRMQASELMQERAFADKVELAYAAMFANWVQSAP